MKKNNPTKTSLMQQLAKAQARANDLTTQLEAAKRELVEDVGVCKVLRRQRDNAEDYLRRTYNILGGFDPEKETPMDEVFGLVLTAAHVTRKNLVELSLQKSKAAKK